MSKNTKPKTKPMIVMTGADWDRLKAIIAKHPEVQAELSAADLKIITVDAPLTDDYVNSDGKVVASHPKTHVSIPIL